MNKDRKKLEKAIERIREIYEAALNNSGVFDPIGYALYRTWSEHNSTRGKERKNENTGTN